MTQASEAILPASVTQAVLPATVTTAPIETEIPATSLSNADLWGQDESVDAYLAESSDLHHALNEVNTTNNVYIIFYQILFEYKRKIMNARAG